MDLPKLHIPSLAQGNLSPAYHPPPPTPQKATKRLNEIIRKTTQEKKRENQLHVQQAREQENSNLFQFSSFTLKARNCGCCVKPFKAQIHSLSTREVTSIWRKTTTTRKAPLCFHSLQSFRKLLIMWNVITANVGPGKFTLESDYHWLFAK